MTAIQIVVVGTALVSFVVGFIVGAVVIAWVKDYE